MGNMNAIISNTDGRLCEYRLAVIPRRTNPAVSLFAKADLPHSALILSSLLRDRERNLLSCADFTFDAALVSDSPKIHYFGESGTHPLTFLKSRRSTGNLNESKSKHIGIMKAMLIMVLVTKRMVDGLVVEAWE